MGSGSEEGHGCLLFHGVSLMGPVGGRTFLGLAVLAQRKPPVSCDAQVRSSPRAESPVTGLRTCFGPSRQSRLRKGRSSPLRCSPA